MMMPFGKVKKSGTWEDVPTTIIRRRLKLAQIIYFAYALCDAIASRYSKLSRRIVKLIRNQCNRGGEEKEGERDEVDSCNDDEHRVTYEVEMYLRRLYLSFKAQSFVDGEGEMDDHYVGSRQQCLYGCVCFVVLFFDLYDNFDEIGMKNMDWLTCTVLNRGCGDLLDSSGLSENEKRVLSSLGGGKKSICQCVFDLVNTKNPSGGLIGPCNCMWFHQLILRLSGRVGAWYKKLIKNHVAIHDAFGFLISQLDVGPGYIYGIYGDLINVGTSDGGNGVSW